MDIKKRLSCDYDKAVALKSYMKGVLNEVINYTEEFGKIDDAETEGVSKRDIDPVISDSVDSLTNFVMSTVFGVKSKWARYGVNEHILKKKFSGAQLEKVKEEYQMALDDNTENVFKFLFDSNYYTEVTKAVRDCTNIGTGCYRIKPVKSTSMPFTYMYRPLNNLYILEDVFGLPNYVFEKHYNKNYEEIQDLWREIKKFPSRVSKTNPRNRVNLIEVVKPEFLENEGRTVYRHMVWTDGFKECILDKTLNYNPYKVFRFSTIKNSPWGRGVGMIALKSFKELEYYKLMRSRQVRKIVDPTTGFIGDKGLMYKLSMEAGVTNYLGDGTNKFVDVKNIGVTGQLLPIDQDINTVKQEIRDLYMAKPFGDVEDMEGSRSTLEIEKRFQLFRQRYSGTAELFYTELLKPTFISPYQILLDNKMIENPDGFEQLSYLRLINNLTRSAQLEEVENLVNYANLVRETFPTYSQFVFKPSNVIWDIAEKMEIDPRLLNSLDEINIKYEQNQQQEKMMAEAMVPQQNATATAEAPTGQPMPPQGAM